MLFHTEHAARFQDRIKCTQVGIDLAVFYPVMDIPERQHAIHLQPSGKAAELPRLQRANHDRSEDVGRSSELHSNMALFLASPAGSAPWGGRYCAS